MSFNPEYSNHPPTPEEISLLSGLTLLEFGSPRCSFCQAVEPMVEEVMNSYKKIPHLKIYDGKGKKLGRSFKVKLWPTLIALKHGQEISRLIRPNNTDEVRVFFDSFK